MKKLFYTLLVLFSFQVAGSAQFTAGGGAAYVFPGSGFGFQAKSLIGINENIDLSPSVGVLLQDGSPLVLDMDLHYNLLHLGDDFRIMPFAGLNYTNGEGDNLGINLGLSIRFDINANTIYIEPKLTIISYGGMALAAGILF